jgi:hypothetical protein
MNLGIRQSVPMACIDAACPERERAVARGQLLEHASSMGGFPEPAPQRVIHSRRRIFARVVVRGWCVFRIATVHPACFVAPDAATVAAARVKTRVIALQTAARPRIRLVVQPAAPGRLSSHESAGSRTPLLTDDRRPDISILQGTGHLCFASTDMAVGQNRVLSSSSGQSPGPSPRQIRTRRFPPSGSSAVVARGYGPSQIRTAIRGCGSAQRRFNNSVYRCQVRRAEFGRRRGCCWLG